jgi:hypothetical protein
VCESMLNNLVYSSVTANMQLVNQNNMTAMGASFSNLLSNNVHMQQQQKTSLLLKPTNTFIWCKVLESIRKFIPSHDYKSCRDIFKMLLEVVKRIPHSNSSYPPHLETELLFIKSAHKHKLLSDYNSFQDIFFQSSSSSSSANLSLVTDDIKLESLYEVCQL